MRGALLFVLSLLAAQAEPDEREIRRQSYGEWVVRDVAESDGGRLIKLEREGDGYVLRYIANYWRGNGGVFRGATVEIGDCGSSGSSELVALDSGETLSEVRDRFLLDLSGCGVTAHQQAHMVKGIDRPYCLFRRWAAEAAAATIDENAQIIAHGTGETVRPSAPSYPDCRV